MIFFLKIIYFSFLLTAILQTGQSAVAGEKKVVRIAYTDWSSSVASAHLVQAVLQEELGRRVDLQRMEAEEMWQAVADDRADAMLSAWLGARWKYFGSGDVVKGFSTRLKYFRYMVSPSCHYG